MQKRFSEEYLKIHIRAQVHFENGNTQEPRRSEAPKEDGHLYFRRA